MMRLDGDAVRRVQAAFEDNFVRDEEIGAEVCVWQDGREVLRFGGGWRDAAQTVPWTSDTLVLCWSATKGPAAACALHALQEADIALDVPVSSVWPEFGTAGKERLTFAELLAHRAGLAVLETDGLDIFELETVAEALAGQAPNWEPGTAHGYAPRTFGYLLDAVVRRTAGMSLGDYWRKVFGNPLALSFWIGLPDEWQSHVARMHAARVGDLKEPGPFEHALADKSSLTARSFARPAGITGAAATNRPEVWRAALPSFGGIGNARSLARFYDRVAVGEFFRGAWREALTRRISNGPDLVLRQPTAFAAGFMMDPLDASGAKLRATFGPSPRAFGHPGAGGSLAFADPENRIGFAYVMNRMENGVLREARPARLVQALYGVVG
ncbi:MAG: serine hydrolase domain-containing protein [Chthoniobacterales bacterium]|jgi:CubicO group peptidase (beta-lactamase class C family)